MATCYDSTPSRASTPTKLVCRTKFLDACLKARHLKWHLCANLSLPAQLGAVRANWKHSDVSPVFKKPGRPSLTIQRTLLDRSSPLGTFRGNEKRLSRRGARGDGCICRVSTTPSWLWILPLCIVSKVLQRYIFNLCYPHFFYHLQHFKKALKAHFS